LALIDIFEKMAPLGGDSYVKYLDRVPSRNLPHVVRCSIGLLDKVERSQCLDYLYSKSSGDVEDDYALIQGMGKAFEVDPQGSLEWISTLPDGRSRANLKLAVAKAKASQPEAARLFGEAIAESPGREKQMLSDALEYLGTYNGGERIPAFVAELPPGMEMTADDLRPNSNRLMHKGVGIFMGAVRSMPDPGQRAAAITDAIDRALAHPSARHSTLSKANLDLISREIEGMSFTGADAGKVRAAMDRARNP
jgi:hypothetical protein